MIAEERPAPKRRPSLPSAPLTPQTQAEIEDLTRAIRAAVDAEIGERAAHLATTDDAHRFGQNALDDPRPGPQRRGSVGRLLETRFLL